MKRLLVVAIVALSAVVGVMANQLDDVFVKICSLEGVEVSDIPEYDCLKEGFDSGKVAMIVGQHKVEAVRSILAKLDDPVISEEQNGIKVLGWQIVESENKATGLVATAQTEGQDVVMVVVLAKGPENSICQ